MSEDRWRITVDHEACIGSAICAGTLPSRFAIVNNKSTPIDAEIEPDDDVLGVADSCPMEAIRVTEVSTGKVLGPTE